MALPAYAHMSEAKLHEVLENWIRENHAPAAEWGGFKVVKVARFESMDGRVAAYGLDLAPAALRTSGGRHVNPSRKEVGELARGFMIDKGAPMTRGEILARLSDIGKPVLSQDPNQNIGTMMWRLRDEFINVEGRGYWPKNVPLPEDKP
jgi:hypothetical protein